MSIVLGYDPVTLRERVDLQALGARLEELGPLRSSEALNEKVGLLRLAGRLDEAMDVANAAVRMARFGGDREALLFARVRRAQVQQYQGRAESALVELSDCVAEASGHDWPDAEAFALQHRGKVYFDLDELDRALRDFRQAHTIRTRIQTSQHQIEASLVALTVTESMLGHAHGAGAGAVTDAVAEVDSDVSVGPDAEGAAADVSVAEAATEPVREATPTRVPTAAWAYAQAVSARAAEEEAAAAAQAAADAPAPRGSLWSRVAGAGSRRESARQASRHDGTRADGARGERRQYDAARRDPAERAAERAADQHHETPAVAPRQQAAASAIRRDPAAPDAITTGSLALHSTLFDIEPGETDG